MTTAPKPRITHYRIIVERDRLLAQVEGLAKECKEWREQCNAFEVVVENAASCGLGDGPISDKWIRSLVQQARAALARAKE